jgi:hypothetical protein
MRLIPFRNPESIFSVIRTGALNKPYTLHPDIYESVKKLAKRDKIFRYSCSNDGNFCVISKIGGRDAIRK